MTHLPTTHTRASKRTTGLMWTLAATQFLLILDTAILNVAVPHIAAGTGLGKSQQAWVINAFVVPFAGLLLPAGYAADRLGRRRILSLGLALIAGGAALGSVASDGAAVLFSRGIQGIGGALAGAAALSLVFASFEEHERQKALTLFAVMAGAGGVGGTLIGGAATQWLGWRSLFVLNVVVSLGLLDAVRRNVPADSNVSGARRSIALSPAVALTVSLGGCAYSITAAGAGDLTALPVWFAGLVGCAGAVVFVAHEARSRRPMLPRAVWSNASLRWPVVLAGLSQFVLTPLFLLVSIELQESLEYGPAAAGLALLPMSILIVAVAPMLPRQLNVLGAPRLASLGFLMVAAASAWLTLLDDQGGFVESVLGPTLLVAVGLPALSVATSWAASVSAGSTAPGLTAGLLSTAQQLGASLGLAILPATAVLGGLTVALGCGAGMAAVGALFALLRLEVPPRRAESIGGWDCRRDGV